MMKILRFLVPVLWLALLGCASKTAVSYQTAIEIAPSDEPGQYDVAARVVREIVKERSSLLWSGGSRRIERVGAPRLTCEPGKAASCTVTTADGETGVLLEAYIAKQDEKRKSTCSLTVKKDGKVVNVTDLFLPPLAQ